MDNLEYLPNLTKQAKEAVLDIIERAKVGPKQIVLLGCSTSEVSGSRIGKNSSVDIAEALMKGIYSTVINRDLFLAVQCCEHLNRAVVVERECAEKFNLRIVAAVPIPKAGGAMGTVAFDLMKDPVLVDSIEADAGLDIGDTLIGMHMKRVVVPTRLPIKKIGEANVTYAFSRPPYIGGERAVYM